MRKLWLLIAVLLFSTLPVYSQSVLSPSSGGGGITSVAVAPSGTCTSGQINILSSVGGANAGSVYVCGADVNGNLIWMLVSNPNFSRRFWGLSPQDFGAKGDTHSFAGCSATINLPTLTCTTEHPFFPTDCHSGVGCTGPVDKQIEFNDAGSNQFASTIIGYTSSSVVTIGTNFLATNANIGPVYGTDDTAALQAWVAAIIALATSGVPNVARGGYLPQGGYWTFKALRFVGPSAAGVSGEGSPGPGPNSGQLRPSLWLTGSGADNAYIYAPGAFQWNQFSNATNTGVLYVENWDFPIIENFAIQAANANAHTNWNTSAHTGTVGGFVLNNVTHVNSIGMYVSGMSNTQGTMCGLCIQNDFESAYYAGAFEVNDANLVINPLASGVAQLFEKMYFDGIFFENANVNSTLGNVVFRGNSTFRQFHMHNIHFRSDTGAGTATWPINIASGVTLTGSDAFVCDECRVTQNSGGAATNGIVIQSPGRWVFNDLYFENTNDGAAGNAFLLTTQSGIILRLKGGDINCVNCTNAVTSNTTGNTVYATDVGMTAPATLANFGGGTNPATIVALFETATGWNGPGSIGASAYNTFTNCLLGGAAGTTSPAACGSSAAGKVAIPASQTTYTVNTSAVTANSEIVVQQTNDNSGISTATCNTGATAPINTSRVAGTSFTISLTSVASVTCIQYEIKN